MVMEQYDILLINLDPTIGHEIKKIRPCVLISPDEMNNIISTVIIAPMTSKSHNYPTRIKVKLKGIPGWVVLDQIRAVDKIRIIKKIGKLNSKNIEEMKKIIKEMLVE
ncbi:MAG: type II toxin-antitoxin system PemK/MazF family toxin [Treponema sp.]|jgi:mRNA interferase MazF|nr:type II toxin-antitoxin system PemK/MazF family toxin [Treponema sp.]